jgi:hypothetical protein
MITSATKYLNYKQMHFGFLVVEPDYPGLSLQLDTVLVFFWIYSRI